MLDSPDDKSAGDEKKAGGEAHENAEHCFYRARPGGTAGGGNAAPGPPGRIDSAALFHHQQRHRAGQPDGG